MKKPFRPILVHRIFIGNKKVKVLGKNYNSFRHLLIEKIEGVVSGELVFEHLIRKYVDDFKKQCPETYNNHEHLFFPTTTPYFSMEPFPPPRNAENKTCIIITCFKTSDKQSREEFLKKFREMCIKGLDNSLDYYEFFFRSCDNSEEIGMDTFNYEIVHQMELKQSEAISQK